MSRSRLALGTLGVVALVAGLAATLTPSARSDTPTPHQITVQGVGSVDAVPDQVAFSFGVQTSAKTASAALAANADAATKLIAALKAAGIPAKSLQTQQVSLSQRLSDDGQTILGYNASSSRQRHDRLDRQGGRRRRRRRRRRRHLGRRALADALERAGARAEGARRCGRRREGARAGARRRRRARARLDRRDLGGRREPAGAVRRKGRQTRPARPDRARDADGHRLGHGDVRNDVSGKPGR